MRDLRAALPQTDVSRETLERLEHYEALLKKWSRRINLVAPSTLAQAWARHIEDSAQVLAMCPGDARKWVDLGSGGGFPGMVVAILGRELFPELQVTLIESDTRKATFLRTVAREADVSATVLPQRIEEATPQNADVVSARALAPLPVLLGYVARHCRPSGTALLLKGEKAHSELSEARKHWHFKSEESQSATHKDAVILKVWELQGV